MAGNPFNLSGGPDGADALGGDEQAPSPGQPPMHEALHGRAQSLLRGPAMRANLLLAALFLCGAGGVYVLSLRGGPAKASAEQQFAEAQMDTAILRISSMPDSSAAPSPGRMTRELLQTFYNRVTSCQVPLEKLGKNPFVFVPPVPPPAAPAQKPAVDVAETQPAEYSNSSYQQALATFRGLRLQSIMMGNNGGTAIISNNLLTAGQQIDGFTVKAVNPKSVVLTWHDREFELKMP